MPDIAGQDIHAYKGTPNAAMIQVRDWLRAVSGTGAIVGGSEIALRYRRFMHQLRQICMESRLREKELIFADYVDTIGLWLLRNR
jgi:hypothetical protein